MTAYDRDGIEIPDVMNLQSWPADEGECAYFEDLCDPLAEAVEFCYDLTRKNADKTVPYRGFPGVRSAGALPANAALTAESLEYNETDQGRSPLLTIIGVAVQVGMEQQRRLMLGDHGRYRSEYSTTAALEEALVEADIPERDLPMIEFTFREKLRDPNGIKALDDRQAARVTASLEARRVENERLRVEDPEEYSRRAAAMRELFDRISKDKP